MLQSSSTAVSPTADVYSDKIVQAPRHLKSQSVIYKKNKITSSSTAVSPTSKYADVSISVPINACHDKTDSNVGPITSISMEPITTFPDQGMAKKYNPNKFNCRPSHARFFIIKSFKEDIIYKSIKYGTWGSTEMGNRRLDKAFRDNAGKGPIYLFFNVNSSGYYNGMAEMLTPVDYTTYFSAWTQDRWKGVFKVKWIFVKDIPNKEVRHINVTNNENKPVTHSRDTQELLPEAGREMLNIFLNYRNETSILDDSKFYEKTSCRNKKG
ncbi:23802_t:CDS:2 [Cetraspora pellucida]|uniref:23802_t:CDS:1 n=1 Tax=Cetraspora pellucida TaxID=1433469 RepID=A0A9N9E3F4_9GLOM|nr:23802_t:CDS:2 [Cetraspora pellucida]